MIIRLIITINLKSICILTGVSLIFSLPYRQVSNSVSRPRSAHQLVPLWSPGSILQGCLLLLWRVKLQLIPGTHIKSSHKPSIMAGASCSKLSDVRPSPWSRESFKRNTALSGLNSTMQRRKTKQIMGRIHAKVHISPLFFHPHSRQIFSSKAYSFMVLLKSFPEPLLWPSKQIHSYHRAFPRIESWIWMNEQLKTVCCDMKPGRKHWRMKACPTVTSGSDSMRFGANLSVRRSASIANAHAHCSPCRSIQESTYPLATLKIA